MRFYTLWLVWVNLQVINWGDRQHPLCSWHMKLVVILFNLIAHAHSRCWCFEFGMQSNLKINCIIRNNVYYTSETFRSFTLYWKRPTMYPQISNFCSLSYTFISIYFLSYIYDIFFRTRGVPASPYRRKVVLLQEAIPGYSNWVTVVEDALLMNGMWYQASWGNALDTSRPPVSGLWACFACHPRDRKSVV